MTPHQPITGYESYRSTSLLNLTRHVHGLTVNPKWERPPLYLFACQHFQEQNPSLILPSARCSSHSLGSPPPLPNRLPVRLNNFQQESQNQTFLQGSWQTEFCCFLKICSASWIINKVRLSEWESRMKNKDLKVSYNMGPLNRVAIMGAQRETE